VRRTVDADDEEMLDFTWQAVLVFLGLACAVLLLLYFFYKVCIVERS
jgi:RsiW-degrading membrane proteinase PrsW (M82 family)